MLYNLVHAALIYAEFERDFLLNALRRHSGNISKAAEEIGMYRQNLQQKIRELGISADEIGADAE